MTQKQITKKVKQYIQDAFGYKPYVGQVKSIGNTVHIENRDMFAPFSSAKEICEQATGMKFAACGTYMAHPLFQVESK